MRYNRPCKVSVRLSKEERDYIEKKAKQKHISVSEYIRICCQAPPPVTRKEFLEIKMELIYQLRKIGVNINQIAKKYNEHQYVEPSADLLDKLDEVYAMMKSTIRIMKGGKDVTDY